MPDDLQSLVQLIVNAATFLLVLSLWLAAVLIIAARRKRRASTLHDRLHVADTQPAEARTLRLWHEGESVTMTVRAPSRRHSILRHLDRQCQEAGWSIAASHLITLVALTSVLLGSATAMITHNFPLAVGVGLSSIIIFRMVMVSRITRNMKAFDQQLVNAMELAARSLRAGHPLLAAFQLIADELTPPISRVFADICQRHELGESLDDSLQAAAHDSPSPDLKMFATSISIQTRTGGNLADLMDRLATVIRQRLRLNRRVRVLTAQTQMSKRVLLMLPFLIFILLNVINPSYMLPLYSSSVGRFLLGVSVALLAAGAWLMNRMAVVHH